MLLSGQNMIHNVTLTNISGLCYNFIKMIDHLKLDLTFEQMQYKDKD